MVIRFGWNLVSGGLDCAYLPSISVSRIQNIQK